MRPHLLPLQLWTCAAVLRVLKHVIPFEALVRLVHTPGRGDRSPRVERALERYLSASGRFPRRAPGNCLERSLGAYRLLCAAGARPDLVVGVRRSAAGAQVEGHVWITLDGRPFAERPEFLQTFAIVVTYDANGQQRRVATGDALAGARFA
jgi:hypothetical protein